MNTTAQQAADDRAAATPATRQFVTFEVAGERYAVDMAPVQEIIRVPTVARLPLTPPALEGLANLRGRVLPVVCLRRLLGLPERPHDDATRALVVDLGSPMGFVVDRVASVVDVAPAEIEAADAVQGVLRAEALLGVFHHGEGSERRLVMVIDFARLVATRLAALAERRASAGQRAEAATTAAQLEQAAAQDELRVVSFAVDAQEYAIDIAAVREIVQMPAHVTTLPDAPAHLLGLVSLRERLLPLVSLRSLFGMAARDRDAEAQRIVVVALPGGAQVGLVTDSVKEVLSVPRALAEAVPEVLSRTGELQELEAICRLGDGRRLVSIIAAERLLRTGALQQAVAAAREHEERQDMTQESDTNHADASAGDDMQVVIFRLGAEEFGVPIMSVQEIVRVPQTLTRVPRTPDFVEGVINLRGSVLPVIDQRRRFGLPAVQRNDRQRIMVYTLGAARTGFIVDAVAEVLRIARQDVEAAPDLGEAGELVAQVAKLDGGARLVMLIEPQRLLAAAELRRLAEPDEPDEAGDLEPAAIAVAAAADDAALLAEAA